MRPAVIILGVVLILFALAEPAVGQDTRIGIIDFYGLRDVSESQGREALKIVEGDPVPDLVTEAEHRLKALPGVLAARVSRICCTGGRTILFVGIEEQGRPALQFRSAPQGSIRLSDDVVQAGGDFDKAIHLAALRGDAGEDDSNGHALMHDPTARAIQERFVVYAARDLRRLRQVLRHSAAEGHRALAAEVLGYAPDKQDVVEDLVYGMRDPSEEVRNNSMRALGIISQYGSRWPELKIRVPTKPFIRLLNSLVWTDRNKASFSLMELTSNRDSSLLKSLRKRAVRSLIEMARWKSAGHAYPAFCLLGRIGGLPEDQIHAAWSRSDREEVIDAALKRP